MRKKLLETRIMEEEMDTSNGLAAAPPQQTERAPTGVVDLTRYDSSSALDLRATSTGVRGCSEPEVDIISFKKQSLSWCCLEDDREQNNCASSSFDRLVTSSSSGSYFDGEEKKDLPENANKDVADTKKEDEHKSPLEETSNSSDGGSSDGSGSEDGQTSDPDKDKFSGNGSSDSGISGRGSPGGGNSSGDDTDNTVGSAVTDVTFVEEDSSLPSCPDRETDADMQTSKGATSPQEETNLTTGKTGDCVLRHYTSMVTTSVTSAKSSIPTQSYITPCFQPSGVESNGTSTHCTASLQRSVISAPPQNMGMQSGQARLDGKFLTSKDTVAQTDLKDIQQAKMKRYQQVLEHLRKSGLFEVTLRTAKLMRQSRLIQAQINALRADAQRLSQSVVQDYSYLKTAATSER